MSVYSGYLVSMAREAVAIDFVGLSRGSNKNAVRPLAAAGVQAMSTMQPEGFRNWVNHRVDTTTTTTTSTSDFCRPNQHILAAGRLGSKESSAADDSQVTEESLPQHSVDTVAAPSFARPHSNVGKHPGTAQLTVFYAGMVNVYDDVPFDKAQAIMVLAGRARTLASSDDTNVHSGGSSASEVLAASIAMNQPVVSRGGSPSPQLTTKPERVPTVKWPKTIPTKVELPQARKASLARFLERRKDRLRSGPYMSATQDVTMRSNRVAPNSSKQTSTTVSSPTRSNGE